MDFDAILAPRTILFAVWLAFRWRVFPLWLLALACLS
jgi:hypothetical protein